MRIEVGQNEQDMDFVLRNCRPSILFSLIIECEQEYESDYPKLCVNQ